MTTSIYFVRHAVSPFSFGNERTRGLSDAGLLAAEKVAALLENEGIDYIFSSPYKRAIQTVQYLAAKLDKDIIEIEELRERAAGSLDVEINEAELIQAMEQSFADLDFCLAGGETIRQAQERAIPVMRRLLHDYEGKKLAIGTHGNIMTAIFNHYDQSYGYAFWANTTKPDIYRLDFEGDKLIKVDRLWKPNVFLSKPTIELKEEYLSFYQEWKDSGEDMVPWVISKDPSDFQAMVQFLADNENGVNLKEGWVPDSTYWLVSEDRKVLGAVNIRHELTEYLLNAGGHIGYGIRRSDRRKGYATQLLKLSLEKAKELGIYKVLVVCDESNLASEKTILNNDGVPDADFVEENGNVVKRFWISNES